MMDRKNEGPWVYKTLAQAFHSAAVETCSDLVSDTVLMMLTALCGSR